MNTTYNKFLIAFAITLIIGGVYSYFSFGLDVQADTTSTDSALSSSATGGKSDNSSASNDQITKDTAFLSTLTSLTRIKIDDSIFKDPSFVILKDNTVVISSVVPGRSNPFAPVNTAITLANAETSGVITNPATSTTDTSAVLNGTTDDTAGITSVYFEYGETERLGKVTQPAKQSLIRTFSTNITGLTSKKAYYYRAVANINGVVRYGDKISFATN